MLYDRPYMRQAQRPAQNLIKILIVANITVFVLQLVLQGAFPTNLLALWADNFLIKPWTFITYSFLHDTRQALPLHLLFNLLGIYFIGKALENFLNPRQLGTLFFGSVLSGSIVWLAANWGQSGSTLIGASAGVLGLLTYFCMTRPNEPVTFLLFFVIPVTMKPKWLVWGVFALEIYLFLGSELRGMGSVAHSAHLGGMLGAVLFYRFGMGMTFPMPSFLQPRKSFRPVARTQARKPMRNPFPSAVQGRDKDDLQREVDRILDKINEQGFGALTPEEKRTLDDAKDVLRR